jgi:LPPG:FO 2-phospho-L-lactate transferase
MYTLGGAVDEEQGWGRADETHSVQGELAAYGAQPQWFGLGDRDFGTHIVRSQWLGQGLSLSEVTARLCARWGLPDHGVALLPMSDSPVQTHVVIGGEGQDPPRAVHFQEWWVRMHAAVPAQKFVAVGMDRASAAPGVLDAIREADIVVLPPSNPVVSIGIILTVPGVRDALRGSTAPVVGVSPLISGAPVRGHADVCLSAIGVESTTQAVAGLYADFLDGWLIDDVDGPATGFAAGLEVQARPLWMHDLQSAADIAGAAVDLAMKLRRRSPA